MPPNHYSEEQSMPLEISWEGKMPDHNKNNQNSIDELLSIYADQVIGSENPSIVPLSDDADMKKLQETVLQLNQLTPSPASAESTKKIRQNLLLAWEKQYRDNPSLIAKINRKIKPAGKTKGYQSTSRRRQQTVLRISAAALVVLILTVIFMPGLTISGGSTSGAASGTLNPSVISIGLLIIGAIGLWWWIKSRRN
jgi:hypothetical protein